MKRTELINILRQLVKEEIQNQIPRILGEVFSGFINNRSLVSEQTNSSQNGLPQNISNMKTGNSAVDAILSGVQPPNNNAGPKVTIEEDFTKTGESAAQQMNPKFPNGSLMNMITNTISTTPIANGSDATLHRTSMQAGDSVLDNTESLPPAVANVFNKDFRAILKKIEQKKK